MPQIVVPCCIIGIELFYARRHMYQLVQTIFSYFLLLYIWDAILAEFHMVNILHLKVLLGSISLIIMVFGLSF